MTDTPRPKEADFFGGMIVSAENIALRVFRDFIEGLTGEERARAIKKYRRKIYHLAETSRLPVFRLGSTLCARESALKEFIENQERQASRKAAFPDDMG